MGQTGQHRKIFAAGAAPAAFVQANQCGANTTTCTITLGTAVTAGNRLMVFVLSNSTNNTPTMTGETFTALTGTTGCTNNTGDDLRCWSDTSAVGGQTTITCTTTGSSIMAVAIESSHPQNLSTPKDAGGNSQAASGTSFTVSTSATTTVAGDIVEACFGSIPLLTTYTVGAGYTLAAQATSGAGSELMCEYAVPGSTGVQTATATSGTSVRTAAGIVALKP